MIAPHPALRVTWQLLYLVSQYLSQQPWRAAGTGNPYSCLKVGFRGDLVPGNAGIGNPRKRLLSADTDKCGVWGAPE